MTNRRTHAQPRASPARGPFGRRNRFALRRPRSPTPGFPEGTADLTHRRRRRRRTSPPQNRTSAAKNRTQPPPAVFPNPQDRHPPAAANFSRDHERTPTAVPPTARQDLPGPHPVFGGGGGGGAAESPYARTFPLHALLPGKRRSPSRGPDSRNRKAGSEGSRNTPETAETAEPPEHPPTTTGRRTAPPKAVIVGFSGSMTGVKSSTMRSFSSVFRGIASAIYSQF